MSAKCSPPIEQPLELRPHGLQADAQHVQLFLIGRAWMSEAIVQHLFCGNQGCLRLRQNSLRLYQQRLQL